ncbi:methylenetetrahydrofolate reductase [Streptomyces sp. NPDC059373]
MNHAQTPPATAVTDLLDDFSLEITGKDVAELQKARATIPPGTRINVTFLGNEDLRLRLEAAREVKRLGFVPVPHIAARRLPSLAALEEFLAALQADGTADSVFVVGGDPATPHGPYQDSLGVIRSGLLEQYGVRHVGISGYPEGHPAIGETRLWTALEEKHAALARRHLSAGVITQFGFDTGPVLDWLAQARKRGIGLPVRIGVPGPAGVRRLLGYATRFGIGTSASIAKKYGLSLTNLVGTAGPDRFIRALAHGYDPQRHGPIKLHFYTFGGLKTTSQWVTEFQKEY